MDAALIGLSGVYGTYAGTCLLWAFLLCYIHPRVSLR